MQTSNQGPSLSNDDMRIAGKYKVGKKIGAGSFGDIYLGINIVNGEEVAIKVIFIVYINARLRTPKRDIRSWSMKRECTRHSLVEVIYIVKC